MQAKVEHGALLGVSAAIRHDVWYKIKKEIGSDLSVAVADLLDGMFEPDAATRQTLMSSMHEGNRNRARRP
jgi:hypothetical protein